MRQLMPHQASKVQLYKEPIPLFHRYQVESQFDAMHSPTVQLRSGGYIVINPTEALVAIDVNSGRSTKERNIEETALRTNLEAAEEIARQVRLRDLAGLIVIDFIDMEETRHQRQVEHKMKDAMRNDRARIQIGRISAFGLLEMSRQRLRPSLLEHSTEICPHCAGAGRVRSIEFGGAACAARDRGGRRAPPVERDRRQRAAQRRALSAQPEAPRADRDRAALRLHVTIEADDELHAADCEIERVRPRRDDQRPAQELARASYDAVAAGDAPPPADDAEIDEAAEPEPGDEGERERLAGDEEGGTAATAVAAVAGAAAAAMTIARKAKARTVRRLPPRTAMMPHRPATSSRWTPIANPSATTRAAASPRAKLGPMARSAASAPLVKDRGDDPNGDGGDANRRRRGRRGGRRRRRENGDGSEPAGEHAHQHRPRAERQLGAAQPTSLSRPTRSALRRSMVSPPRRLTASPPCRSTASLSSRWRAVTCRSRGPASALSDASRR